MACIIQMHNLVKDFSGNVAINDVSMEIESGKLFGLLGPNGSGKSTLIKILTGQIKPTKGYAKVMSYDVLKHPVEVREKVGIIPEQENPPSFLTAIEYLNFVGEVRKINDLQKKINHWFKFLDFEDQKNVLCKDLSRGTRQKLMFSQAFLHEPKVAFIDEPLINLDPISQKKVKEFLVKSVKKGNTIFFSTHVLEIAQEICTDIGVIIKGQIKYQGTIKKRKLESFFIKLVKDNA